ncbi:MAG TPA: alpha/beta hydrolase [Smithellaceae bacterium]|nr:alpha/beta hydrolase [Smithellaceae bacterium]HRS82480.1 alpha/beta hydrolase [Smithellaceae bacterium]HRV44761.1 alpha/beta hydrolase [Smithellaceae bacterium]
MKRDIPELKHQDVGGAELPYLHYPGGEKQMLFCHATGFLPWLWHPIIEAFSPEYTIWAPYICNYRTCDPHQGGLKWNIIAEDLGAFCRAQKIEHHVQVGHSMGATVSTIAASLFGVRPRGMVLIEPIFLPEEFYSLTPSVEGHPLASKSIKRLNYWQSEEDAHAYLKSRSFFTTWDDEILQLYKRFGMEKMPEGDMRLACSPESEAAMFMGGWCCNPWPLLEKIGCPALVIEGEQSPNVAFVDLKRAVSLLPRGEFGSVPGAGHLIPMEKPGEITAILKNFVAKLNGA